MIARRTSVLVFLAFWVVLFTGQYPERWHAFNVTGTQPFDPDYLVLVMDVATPLVNEFCARMGMYAGLTPGRNEHQDENSQRVAWNVHQDFAFKNRGCVWVRHTGAGPVEPGLPELRRSVDGAVPVLYLGFGGFQVLDAAARLQLVVALLGVDKGHLMGVLQRLALNQFPPVGYPSQRPAGEGINPKLGQNHRRCVAAHRYLGRRGHVIASGRSCRVDYTGLSGGL